MFSKVVKRLQLLVENVMLFDTLDGLFPKGVQNDQETTGFIRYSRCLFRCAKTLLNQRFFMVWRATFYGKSTFLDASKRCFTKGFLMFSENVKLHQLVVKNIILF